MERKHYLYKITNMVNGKIYIGQAVCPDKRWRDHKNSKEDDAIHNAIRKYGKEAFHFMVIAECNDKSAANDLETELIVQYGSHVSLGKGYNIKWRDGSNGEIAQETKDKISAKLLGNKNAEGRHVSIETREKLRSSNSTPISILQEQEIIRLYQEENKTTHDIRKIFHISPMRVSAILRINNIEIRYTTKGKILGPRTDAVKEKCRIGNIGKHAKQI